jgi:hypothetical protein
LGSLSVAGRVGCGRNRGSGRVHEIEVGQDVSVFDIVDDCARDRSSEQVGADEHHRRTHFDEVLTASTDGNRASERDLQGVDVNTVDSVDSRKASDRVS